jgi:hypothetical protein
MSRRSPPWGPVDTLALFSVLMSLLLLLLTGCVQGATRLDTGLVPENPTFTQDIEPLMARYCTRCHAAGGVRYEGVGVNTYDAIIQDLDEVVCTSISPAVIGEYPDACVGREEVFTMPPGASEHLDMLEQITLARWASNGAPE